MKALLFERQGQISRSEYLHIGGLALMVLSPFSQALTSLLLSFAMMGLVYPYYCLYGKRLESLSYSRWWFVPLLVMFYVSLMLFGYLSGQVSGLYLSETIQSYAKDDLTRVLVFQIPSIITLYFGTVVLDLFLGFLKPATEHNALPDYA